MKKLKRYTWLTLIIICSPIGFAHVIFTRLAQVAVDTVIQLLIWVPLDIFEVFYYGIPQQWEELKKLWERAKKETE